MPVSRFVVDDHWSPGHGQFDLIDYILLQHYFAIRCHFYDDTMRDWNDGGFHLDQQLLICEDIVVEALRSAIVEVYVESLSERG